MKRRLRRIVSWLCVLSLCLSLLPGTAWAAGEEDSPVGPGGSVTLTVRKTITPKWSPNADGADPETWESDDKTVATVDEKGIITAVAEGTTTITHTYYVVEKVEEPAAPVEGGDEPDSKSNAETSFAESDAENVEEPVEDLDGDAGDTTVNSAGEVELMEESAERGNVDADTAESSDDTLEDEPGTDDATTLVYEPKTETVTVTVEAAFQYVAQIVGSDGIKQYETLDDAVEAAEDDETIELLADASLSSTFFPADKKLTIDGNGYTIDAKQVHLSIAGNVIFEDCTMNMYGVPSGNWMYVYMASNGELTFRNARVSIDGTNAAANTTAMYFPEPSTPRAIVNIESSTVTIENCDGNGISWGGRPNNGYNQLNITDSTVTIDNCAARNSDGGGGIIGTFDIEVTRSTLTVTNNKSYGSNGSNYFIDDSTVTYSNNGTHGLSATDLEIVNGSKVTADNNGYYGVYASSAFLVDSTSTLTVTRNSGSGDCAGLKLTSGVTDGKVEDGATVTITDNYCSGLSNNGKVVFEEGVELTITGNVNDKGSTSNGGGVYNSGASADLTLPSDAIIYNNHADTAGDDIYSTGTITFGPVGTNWYLDGDPDCKDLIDGWYDDSESDRWKAHSVPTHVEEFTVGSAAVHGPLALKAAHGVIPLEPGDPDVPNWEKSKSKTATNLKKQEDGTYTSEVTLSLPSAAEELVSDVVFVLDKSTSTDIEEQALGMLDELNNQIKNTGATVKVGVVIFNKEAHVLELTKLNDSSLPAIEAAIRQEISSGTNTHAGLLAAKELLDADTSVSADRKYMVFVSDGITYLFDSPAKAINSQQANTGEYNIMAGNDCWAIRHYLEGGASYLPDDWDTYLADVGSHLADVGPYIQTYGEMNSDNHIPRENTELPTTVDVALYLTAQVYAAMEDAGYHCYAMTADTGHGSSYPWGPSFMDYLSGGKGVSFDDIQNDIYYLLDAGSKVKDYMGYVADDYDFDFVSDESELTLKVGEDTYTAQEIDENQYGFAPNEDGYDYMLTYDRDDGKGGEHFVWEINVPVSNFAPVQLTYTVKLVNPETEPGTYGEYDGNGDGINDINDEEVVKNSLYTNNSAILYPVDSNEVEGIPESFPKPTVSYTVEKADVGSLTISKTVEGMSTEAAQKYEFDFKVTFEGDGEYKYFFVEGDKEGGTITSGGTITLKSGETVSINGIPAGTKYSVSEKEDERFETTVKNNDGLAIATTYSAEAVTASGIIRGKSASIVHFVNTYVTPGVPGLSVTKSVDKIAASVGDVLTYTIAVVNTGTMPLADVMVTDTMTEGRAVTWVALPGGVTVNADNTLTIAGLAPGASVSLTATYAVTEDDLGETIVNTAAAAVPGGPTDNETVTTTVDDGGFSVTIAPADITIYTGGDTYGGVTDANGNIVVKEDGGLPEPGYHLILSDAVEVWLTQQGFSENTAARLDEILRFEYYDASGNAVRRWNLEYQGVYSRRSDGTVSQYVYSLTPNLIAGPNEGTEVRLQYTDPDNQDRPMFDDDILMTENLASDKYDMTIYDGGLNQRDIVAVLEVNGESIPADVEIGTGTLTIRTVTDEGTTTTEIQESSEDVRGGDITAVADDVTYYVNDSEVEVAADRVSLLVDEVSNDAGFNWEMAQDAMDHAIDSSATDWTYRSDLSYEMAYMDLVDIDNGNAMVTMGESDSLTIYWPMPDDADPYGDFHVVHYTGMDRENTMDESGLDNAAKEILTGRAVRIDGRWYVAFDADSFSPFVLVYEEEDNDRPTRPDSDPDDDDKDDEDEETPVDDGLNREDHYAYIAGYEDGTVRPDGNITRAEVATIFFRLMTDEYRETCWSTSSGFTDVTAANWYNNAISTTANAGWVSGYPDGTFRPDAYITRAEFATIAARFLSDVYGGTSMFTDISGHWAEDYINRAAAAGWINGYADGTFRPNAYITRAEAVTLINRMLDRAPDANHLLADMVRWPDNLETAWYYADIQEATNSHDYTRAGTGDYEVWTELLANRDWAALEEIWSQANDAPGGEVMG